MAHRPKPAEAVRLDDLEVRKAFRAARLAGDVAGLARLELDYPEVALSLAETRRRMRDLAAAAEEPHL